MPQYIPAKIAGIFNYPEAKESMKAMLPNAKYGFQRESENPYDKNAIALYVAVQRSDDAQETKAFRVKCGFIPKALAATLVDKNILSVKRGNSFDSIMIEIE